MSVTAVKTKITFVVIVAVALMLSSVSLVSAQADTAVETPVTPAATTTTDPQKLKERVEARKAALKTKLTTVQQKRIQSRCKAAQGLVTSSVAKANSVEANRTKIHSDILDRLNKIEVKASSQGVDTTKLKQQIALLQTKIDVFKTDAAAYSLAAKDTAELDCVADPVAFKASLETSRTALAKLKADAADIRTHLVASVKPALAEIRTQLQSKTEEAN